MKYIKNPNYGGRGYVSGGLVQKEFIPAPEETREVIDESVKYTEAEIKEAAMESQSGVKGAREMTKLILVNLKLTKLKKELKKSKEKEHLI